MDKRLDIRFAKVLALIVGVALASVLILILSTSGSPWFFIARHNHFLSHARSVSGAGSITQIKLALLTTVSAWKVDGVQGGRKLLQMVDASQQKKAVQVPDAVLKQRIEQALQSDPSFKANDIAVQSVNQGVVVLSGNGKNEGVSDHALQLVWAVSGVRRVDFEDNRWPGMRRILETGEHFGLFSLAPGGGHSATEGHWGKFHDFVVLGKAEIRDPEERMKLLDALYRSKWPGGAPAAHCFDPRHGISAKLGDDTVDLVICFECHTIKAYGKNGMLMFRTIDSPLETFNIAVDSAGLPLPRQQH